MLYIMFKDHGSDGDDENAENAENAEHILPSLSDPTVQLL